MALKTLFGFSLLSLNPYTSSLACLSPPSLSSLSFSFNPKSSPKPSTLLLCSSSPIFLPHLEQDQSNLSLDNQVDIQPEEADPDDEIEQEADPIRAFFKLRSQTPDPKQEGRTSLQRNRRTSWHIAPTEHEPAEEIPSLEDPDAQLPNIEAASVSVVEEILKIATNLLENATLGDYLGSYSGKIGKEECVELLVRMGEEGLVWSCLYLFEWMGIQEPALVTPRACSVIFPLLGLAGMGEKVMVLFENLPRTKEFRDVRAYNAAISGLAASRR